MAIIIKLIVKKNKNKADPDIIIDMSENVYSEKSTTLPNLKNIPQKNETESILYILTPIRFSHSM